MTGPALTAAHAESGPRTRDVVERVLARPGTPLHHGPQDGVGARLGVDLSTVRVHTDPEAGASAVGLGAAAYAAGRHVVFAPGRFAPGSAEGDRLLAHELAHVAATDTAEPDLTRISRPGDRDEGAADRAADHALAGRRVAAQPAAPGIHRQAVTDPFAVIDTGPLTAATAKGLLDHYDKLPPSERDAVVRAHHRVGVLQTGLMRWLAALDRTDVRANRELIRDLQERVQRLTVEGVTGKNLGQLGAEQAAFRRGGAQRIAGARANAEARRTGAAPKPVTDADLARAQSEEIGKLSPITPSTALERWTADDQKSWDARATAVIPQVVAACADIAPEFGITAKNFRFDQVAIIKDGGEVFAMSGNPLIIGVDFVRLAEIDPAYVVRTVVHEFVGHPDFGGFAGRMESSEARIHGEARRTLFPDKPAWTPPEMHTYGYIGTEIYAALRELPYKQQLRPSPRASRTETSISMPITPEDNVDRKLALVEKLYAPEIAPAVVQGLYERFRIDPRVSQDALVVFEQAAERHFPKVLRGVPDRPPWRGFGARLELGTEWAGGRVRPHAGLSANVALRWASTALSAGLRLDVSLQDRETFVRAGAQGGVEQRLFGALYLQANLGYLYGFGAASSGVTVGGGVSVHLGSAELGWSTTT